MDRYVQRWKRVNEHSQRWRRVTERTLNVLAFSDQRWQRVNERRQCVERGKRPSVKPNGTRWRERPRTLDAKPGKGKAQAMGKIPNDQWVV